MKFLVSQLLFILLFDFISVIKWNQTNNHKATPVSSLTKNRNDSSSFSNTHQVYQTKLDLNLFINTDDKYLTGEVKLFYKCITNTTSITLDIRNITIHNITDPFNNLLKFAILPGTSTSNNLYIGDVLRVQFHGDNTCEPGKDSFLTISYSTNPNAVGYHFSKPEMHQDQNFEFFYTHGEPIYTRSYIPCQDSPSVKVIVSATIKIKRGYTVLFSGILNATKALDRNYTEYSFSFSHPLPTYDINIAAGRFEKYKISQTSMCNIYAESNVINKRRKSLNKTFKLCDEILKFYSEYHDFKFNYINFIITPNDFPTNANENPFAITFAKSMLTEDGSWSKTVTHELAHFWAGNLVTNLNWGCYWINEGIATYLNRKANKMFFGADYFNTEMLNGISKIKNVIATTNNNLKDVFGYHTLNPTIWSDPSFSFSSISYEKGALFLFHIESVIGERWMKQILIDYFNEFEFRSVDTAIFVSFFKKKIMEKTDLPLEEKEDIVNEIKWDEYLYRPDIEGIEHDYNYTLTQSYSTITAILNNLRNDVNERTMTLHEMIGKIKAFTTCDKLNLMNKLYRNIKELNLELIEEWVKSPDLKLKSHVELKAISKLIQVMIEYKGNARGKYRYWMNNFPDFKYAKAMFIKDIISEMSDYQEDTEKLKRFLHKYDWYIPKFTKVRIERMIDGWRGK